MALTLVQVVGIASSWPANEFYSLHIVDFMVATGGCA